MPSAAALPDLAEPAAAALDRFPAVRGHLDAATLADVDRALDALAR